MTHNLSHLDAQGRAQMVDVGAKATTGREAVAVARLRLGAATEQALWSKTVAKGDALAVARVAGIQAAKRTGELIPLCHPLGLTYVGVEFARGPGLVWVKATARCAAQTGVEMEALTAASVAALTLYDMLKALDKGMVLEQVALLSKTGGKSGDFFHPDATSLTPPEGVEWG